MESSRFEASVENGPEVTPTLSPTEEVIYASASSAKLFGHHPEELVGKNIFELIHPDDRPAVQRAVHEIRGTPLGTRHVEARIYQENGDWCWVESTVSNHLHEPCIAAIVMNCREACAEVQRRRETEAHAAQLARANTELEHFAYAVAHDLREPLRSISMFTEMLVLGEHLDAQGKELAHFITQGVTRVSALFEGLHAFAIRGFDEAPRPVHLEQVVAEAQLNLAQALTSSGAQVTADALPWVQGTNNQLVRIVQNLILNAVKYRGPEVPKIHLSAQRDGEFWTITVRDNGVGIAPENHELVFHLLKRLHTTEAPGAGFGLAICRKMAEEMGGRIWVESALGEGCAFRFTVAAAEAPVSTASGPGAIMAAGA